MIQDQKNKTEEDEIYFEDLVNWTPKQQEADDALFKYKFILYGGAMGGGKSYWLRWELLQLLLRFYSEFDMKNVMVGLFCEDYPSLKDRHLSKIKFEFPEWLGTYKEIDHNFILNPEYGSGVIAFRNLDDPSKYQSAEFACIAIDEITKNKEESFNFLRTRLRWTGLNTFEAKFLAGTNPGGIGHVWVKKRWIDKDFPPEEKEKHLFKFIQAKAQDNPHLDKDYQQTLDSLPEGLKRAFSEGDWDIFQGQYFQEWRKDIHTCRPFEIPDEWKKFIWLDYGYAKPSAVYWAAINYDGIIYLYRELYVTGRTYKELTDDIVSLTTGAEKISYWVADPACWNTKGEDKLSGGELIQSKYKELTKKSLLLKRGNNDRINGWNTLREYLKPIMVQDKVMAKLQVFDTCVNFIKTFPSLVYDKSVVEDLNTDGEDHAADAVRYGLMDRPRQTIDRKKFEDKFFRDKMRQKQIKSGSGGYKLRMT